MLVSVGGVNPWILLFPALGQDFRVQDWGQALPEKRWHP